MATGKSAAPAENIHLLLDVYSDADSGAPAQVLVSISRAAMTDILRLSAIVVAEKAHIIEILKNDTQWLQKPQEVVGAKPLDSLVRETGLEIPDAGLRRLEAKIEKNPGEMLARVECRSIRIGTHHLQWSALEKDDDTEYKTASVDIATLCERFGIESPLHLRPAPRHGIAP